jgi:ABC-type transporter MlaC component
MIMRKILVVLVISAFAFSSSALAINKTGAKKLERDKADTLIKLDKDKRGTSSGSKRSVDRPKDYNDFIDKNNNGLDDRIEYRKKKATGSQSSSKKKSVEQKKSAPTPEKKTKKK